MAITTTYQVPQPPTSEEDILAAVNALCYAIADLQTRLANAGIA